jgi:hypothetical protein
MRKLIPILIQLFSYGSCLSNSLDSINTKTIVDFPFGCEMLITHEFPKTWEDWGNEPHPNTEYKPHEREMDNVINCFNKLNGVKSFLLPSIHDIEYVKIGDIGCCPINDTLLQITRFYKYQLPNIGLYECYYGYNSGHYSQVPAGMTPDEVYVSEEAGNLILYNKETSNAKVLNIYSLTYDDYSGAYRFFYIDNDRSIQIFQYYSNEGTMSLEKTYKIIVNDNGRIDIIKD